MSRLSSRHHSVREPLAALPRTLQAIDTQEEELGLCLLLPRFSGSEKGTEYTASIPAYPCRCLPLRLGLCEPVTGHPLSPAERRFALQRR